MTEKIILSAVAVSVLFVIVFLVIKTYSKEIPEQVQDSWRRELWESGLKLKSLRPLQLPAAVKVFGLNAISFTSYQSNYFAEIIAENEDGKEISFYAYAGVAFEKKITKQEVKRKAV